MSGNYSMSVVDDGGECAVVLTCADGSEAQVGPRLTATNLGTDAKAHALALFSSSDGSTPVEGELLEESLARAEQLALDRLYLGGGSARQAAHARAIVIWASMVLRALVDALPPSARPRGPSQTFEHRLDCLISLAASEGIPPMALSIPRVGGPSARSAEPSTRGKASIVRLFREARARRGATDPSGARDIVLHAFQNRWAIFYEIAASIAFTTFASAGSFVFLGVRLQKCSGPCKAGGLSGFSASLDIVALVICSFGFLFATLSYANATGVLARWSTRSYSEALERGNRVSEYFGVYPLIFAIPLAVEGATSSPLPLIVKLVALAAFFGYHWSPRFALLERVIAREHIGGDAARRWVVLVLLALLALSWFGPNTVAGSGGLWIRVGASGAFLVAICLIYALASAVPEQSDVTRYEVDADDMISAESPSQHDLQPFRRS